MEIALTSKQIQRISDYIYDVGKGFIATGVLPVLFDSATDFGARYLYFLTSCVLSFLCLVVSLKLMERSDV